MMSLVLTLSRINKSSYEAGDCRESGQMPASLAITTFDNTTDFTAAQFYNQGDVKSAAITIAFPLLSNFVSRFFL